MQLDQQTLADRIKQFLASNSQFRNPKFDPAPFLIQILKQKQSDHQAILQRRKQLIQLQNQAYDLIDEVCSQYAQDLLTLLNTPQKQAEQLQKLRSNMSVVKKKTRQTKSLLANTQKDIDQTYLNCIYNKLIYKKLKQVELKLYQYESASLALKNNEFLNCSLNLPSFKGYSILQSALVTKAENLKLQLLSKGIEQVSLFVYLTPKIVLPTSQSLIQRISSQQTIFGSLKKHQGFHKRYNLFKRAHCIEYLPTLWNFKQLQMKKGKIHLLYDIIKGVMNIGKIQEILQSLELDCKKSVQTIFLLLEFYFSLDVQEQRKQKKEQRKNFSTTQKQQESIWFLCKKGNDHYQFISVVLDVTGVIIRKLIILRLILKEFQIPTEELSNLQCFTFFELILKELNELVQSIYVKEETDNQDYVHEQILKKIKTDEDYIFWPNVRNLLIKSLIIIDENISMIEQQHELSSQKMISKPKWDNILKIDQFDKVFSKKFHIQFMKTLQQIFNHQGKSFAFQSLDLIASTKSINESEVSFCRYYSSQQMKYSKQYLFTISLLAQISRYFTTSNFNPTQCHKYQLYLLSVLYLKLNYYLQRNFVNGKTLQRAYELRRTSSRLKTKEKDFKREFDKICVRKKFQVLIKPWRRGGEEVEQSKYRVVENLKGVEKQNEMLLTYCMKTMAEVEKYKDSENVITQITVFDKLEPTNYDENFSSKLIRIWDQLPEIDTSIGELTLSLFQKFIELHMVIGAVIYLESSTQ